MIYAGIGSKKTPQNILELMYKLAYVYAKNNYICATGACTGADQAFAAGAIAGGGHVQLYLPWPKYEINWINSLPQNQITIRVVKDNDVLAYDSVHKYHPRPDKLTRGVFNLHARNYLILDPSIFVVCWTPNAQIIGGTGQGIRLATDKQKLIENLGDPSTEIRFTNYVNSQLNGV